MEKTFKLKLWDYKNERLNLNGRICLKFSIFWAVLAAIHILFMLPGMIKRIMILGPYYSHFIAGGLFAYFMLDLNHSARSIINFKEFQNNLLKLIEKGGKYIPAFDFISNDKDANKKLPNEFRRLLKPINAFPNLRKSFKEKTFVLPKWINEILEKKYKNK